MDGDENVLPCLISIALNEQFSKKLLNFFVDEVKAKISSKFQWRQLWTLLHPKVFIELVFKGLLNIEDLVPIIEEKLPNLRITNSKTLFVLHVCHITLGMSLQPLRNSKLISRPELKVIADTMVNKEHTIPSLAFLARRSVRKTMLNSKGNLHKNLHSHPLLHKLPSVIVDYLLFSDIDKDKLYGLFSTFSS